MRNLKEKIGLLLATFGLIVGLGGSYNNQDNSVSSSNTIDLNTYKDNPSLEEEHNKITTYDTLNLEGAGTEASPYLIKNDANFEYFYSCVNSNPALGSNHYKLDTDLTVNSASFIGIGTYANPFTGYFDGGNHSITLTRTITINTVAAQTDTTTQYIGLFNVCKGAEISNLNLTSNISITTNFRNTYDYLDSLYVGGLCGLFLSGTSISNEVSKVTCTSTIVVRYSGTGNFCFSTDFFVGGLCGKSEIVLFSDNNIDTSIDLFGSLPVLVYSLSTNSTNRIIRPFDTGIPNLNVNRLYIGGFVGSSNGDAAFFGNTTKVKIKGFAEYLNFTVTINSFIGGFVGYMTASNMTVVSNNNFNLLSMDIGNSSVNIDFGDCEAGGFIGCLDSLSFAMESSYINMGAITIGMKGGTLAFGLLNGVIGIDDTRDLYNIFDSYINVSEDANIHVLFNDTNMEVGVFAGAAKADQIMTVNMGFKFCGINITSSTTLDTTSLAYVSCLIGYNSKAASIAVYNSYFYEQSGKVSYTGKHTLKSSIGFYKDGTDASTLDIKNAYIYLNNSAGSVFADNTNVYASPLTYVSVNLENVFANDLVDDGITSIFDDSKLSVLNSKVASNNAEDGSTEYFYWTLDKKNGIYPTLVTKITFVADNFSDHYGYVYMESQTNNLSEAIVYEDKEVEGLYLEKVGTTYSSETTIDGILSLRTNKTVYVKLSEVITPDPDEPTGPSLPIGTEFDIIYNTKDGTINDETYPTTYICGVGAKLPTIVTKANYDFAGWSYRNLNGVIITEISPRQYGDVYLNANYTISANAKKYTIKYENNDGKINDKNYATSYLDEEVELPTDVTSDYGTFAGWYDNPEFTGRRIYKISDTDTGNKTYYARFIYNQYTISYYLYNGSNNDNPILATYTYGEEVTLMSDITKDGYTFLGFSETKDDATSIITKINKGESGNKVYYAIYKENSKSCNLWWLWLLLILILILIGGGVGYYIYKKKHNKKTA